MVILGELEGATQQRSRQVAAEFVRAEVKCKVTDDIALERWRKLIWNIPFNGLSIVAGGIDTAAIIGDKSLRQAALALMDEVIIAANKCGHALPSDAWRAHMERSEKIGPFKPSSVLDWEA